MTFEIDLEGFSFFSFSLNQASLTLSSFNLSSRKVVRTFRTGSQI